MSVPRSGLGLGSLLVAVAIILAVGVGSAVAAIPNGNGKYSACLVKATGAVRLINFPKVSTCPQGEKLIVWNAKGPQGPAGPVGAQGGTGPEGPQGPAGPAGIANVTLTRTFAADGGVQLSAAGGASPVGANRADCPAGSRVVGGGYNTSTDSGEVRIYQTFAEDSDTWFVAARNTSAMNQSFRAFAVCMSVQPAGVLTTAKKGVLSPSMKKAIKKRR
jgi:hypothetical protein